MSSKYLSKVLDRLDGLDKKQLITLIQRLLRERTLFESVFNTIREGILVIDPSGTIEYANPTAHALLGIPQEDAIKNLWKLAPDLAKIFTSNDFSTDSDDASDRLFSCEFEITYPEQRLVRLHKIPLKSFHHGETKQFLLMFTDITQEKQCAEKRIAQERLSSVFLLAAEVAHEIGNPLNSIQIHLSLAQRQLNLSALKRSKQKMHDSIGICLSEVKRLDGIVKNFLQAIRPQAVVFKHADIICVLEDVLKILEQELKDLRIAVDLQVGTTLPLIAIDENQVKQVFFNILKNAMEAMDQGGPIRIHASIVDNDLVLKFIDQGAGISEAIIGQLFHAHETSKPSGNGLGMMIVQRIMHAHGGTVDVATKQDDGTTITLKFPLQHKRFKRIEQPTALPELTE